MIPLAEFVQSYCSSTTLFPALSVFLSLISLSLAAANRDLTLLCLTTTTAGLTCVYHGTAAIYISRQSRRLKAPSALEAIPTLSNRYYTTSIFCGGFILAVWSASFVISMEAYIVGRGTSNEVRSKVPYNAGVQAALVVFMAMEFVVMTRHLYLLFRQHFVETLQPGSTEKSFKYHESLSLPGLKVFNASEKLSRERSQCRSAMGPVRMLPETFVKITPAVSYSDSESIRSSEGHWDYLTPKAPSVKTYSVQTCSESSLEYYSASENGRLSGSSESAN